MRAFIPTLIIVILSLIPVNVNAKDPFYKVLYDDGYAVPGNNKIFKIIKVEKPDSASSNSYYLTGKVNVQEDRFVDIYIFTAEEYEVFSSGESTDASLGGAEKVNEAGIIISDEAEAKLKPLSFGTKYYIVVSNPYKTGLYHEDAEVHLFLIAFWF